jgi:hypothetical protein
MPSRYVLELQARPFRAEKLTADLTERHGSIRGYAADHLGVDDALVAALRERLLDPEPAQSR